MAFPTSTWFTDSLIFLSYRRPKRERTGRENERAWERGCSNIASYRNLASEKVTLEIYLQLMAHISTNLLWTKEESMSNSTICANLLTFQSTFGCTCHGFYVSIFFNFIYFWGCLTQNRPKWDVMLGFRNNKNIKILMSRKPRTLQIHCVHRSLPWTVRHPKLRHLCSLDPVFPRTRSETNKQKLMIS